MELPFAVGSASGGFLEALSQAPLPRSQTMRFFATAVNNDNVRLRSWDIVIR